MTAPLQDFSRLCLHSITTKPWALGSGATLRRGRRQGNHGLARQLRRPRRGRRRTADSRPRPLGGLVLPGRFFPAATAAGRAKAIDDNLRCIDQAAALGAPLIVLVCGAVPGQPLSESRAQITEGIAAVLPSAAAAGVKLAIEPLHPMYAADRSAVNTIGQARAICQSLHSPWVGSSSTSTMSGGTTTGAGDRRLRSRRVAPASS
jgi:hypothetical protein